MWSEDGAHSSECDGGRCSNSSQAQSETTVLHIGADRHQLAPQIAEVLLMSHLASRLCHRDGELAPSQLYYKEVYCAVKAQCRTVVPSESESTQ